MLDKDYNNFATLWVATKSIYQYSKEVTDAEVRIIFSTLKDYSFNDVSRALSYIVGNSKEIPVPKTIKDTIKMFRHEDSASLELKANKWLADLTKDFSIGQDIICSDIRAVIAFKTVYINVREYNSVTKNNEPFLKKAFIENYVNVAEAYIDKCDYEQGNQIKGIYAHTFNPLVRFIGDIERCKQIAKVVYENKRPRYTTLNDLARIALKRSQNEKLALSGTDVSQSDKNASMSKYVDMKTIQKDMEQLCNMLNVNKRK